MAVGTRTPATQSRRGWMLSAVVALTVVGAASRAEAACSIRVESTVVFGTYNVFGASPLDSTGQISYRCTGTTNATIRISLTRGGSSTFIPRQLRRGSDILSYNLYRDASRTIVWGDGSPGTQVYSAARTSGRVYVTVYGRVPAEQDAAVGAYSDSVTAVVNF